MASTIGQCSVGGVSEPPRKPTGSSPASVTATAPSPRAAATPTAPGQSRGDTATRDVSKAVAMDKVAELMNNGQWSEAVDELGVVLAALESVAAGAAYGSNAVADKKFKCLFHRSKAHLKLQQYSSALVDANTCLSLQPGSIKALEVLALAQLGLKRPDDACQTYADILKQDSTHAIAEAKLRELRVDAASVARTSGPTKSSDLGSPMPPAGSSPSASSSSGSRSSQVDSGLLRANTATPAPLRTRSGPSESPLDAGAASAASSESPSVITTPDDWIRAVLWPAAACPLMQAVVDRVWAAVRALGAWPSMGLTPFIVAMDEACTSNAEAFTGVGVAPMALIKAALQRSLPHLRSGPSEGTGTTLPWTLVQDRGESVAAWLSAACADCSCDDKAKFFAFLESERFAGSRAMPATALARAILTDDDIPVDVGLSRFFRGHVLERMAAVRADAEARLARTPTLPMAKRSSFSHESVVKLKRLGCGAFGEVFLAELAGGGRVAVKVNKGGREADLAKEVDLAMSVATNANVVTVMGCYVDPETDKLHIVMEYCQPGSLHA